MVETQGRPPLSHPAILLATWFGSGYLPKAPGTWGSLAALPVGWVLHVHWGWPGLLVATAVVLLAGVWASGVYMAETGESDPGPVVVDEVAGMWLTLLAGDPNVLHYGVGFALFRVADILKPWPASWADRNLGGPWGVMLDDVFAAVYAAAGVYLLRIMTGG